MSRVCRLRHDLALAAIIVLTACTNSIFAQATPPRFFKKPAPLVPKHEKLAQVYRQHTRKMLAATPIERQLTAIQRGVSDVQQAQYTQPNTIQVMQPDSVLPTETVVDNGIVDPIGCDSCGGCMDDGCTTCQSCVCASSWFEQLTIFGGVQGVKGPANRGRGGSFGFHEGLNWGMPLPYFDRYGWSGQIGFRATQSDFSGSRFTSSSRNQTFVTAGIFRRADWGLQGGIVFDSLRDNWYYDIEVEQVRGELSFALNTTNSIGFWFASNNSEDVAVSQVFDEFLSETWSTHDLYALMYRGKITAYSPGITTIRAGFTGDSDGFVNIVSDIYLPCNWSIQPSFSYVAPDNPRGRGGSIEEAWNIGISLIWRPWASGCGGCSNYNRPLFDVADNGTMVVREANLGGEFEFEGEVEP